MNIKKDTPSPSLVNFDALPDAAYVRQPVVEALYGISSATVWRWVNAGMIPAPKKLADARVTAWNVGSLRASLASLQLKLPLDGK